MPLFDRQRTREEIAEFEKSLFDVTTIEELIPNAQAKISTDLQDIEQHTSRPPRYLLFPAWMSSYDVPSVISRHIGQSNAMAFVLLLPYGADPKKYIEENGLMVYFKNPIKKFYVVHYMNEQGELIQSLAYDRFHKGYEKSYVRDPALLAKAEEK